MHSKICIFCISPITFFLRSEQNLTILHNLYYRHNKIFHLLKLLSILNIFLCIFLSMFCRQQCTLDCGFEGTCQWNKNGTPIPECVCPFGKTGPRCSEGTFYLFFIALYEMKASYFCVSGIIFCK